MDLVTLALAKKYADSKGSSFQKGLGAPTELTPGKEGDIYFDEQSGTSYIMVGTRRSNRPEHILPGMVFQMKDNWDFNLELEEGFHIYQNTYRAWHFRIAVINDINHIY